MGPSNELSCSCLETSLIYPLNISKLIDLKFGAWIIKVLFCKKNPRYLCEKNLRYPYWGISAILESTSKEMSYLLLPKDFLYYNIPPLGYPR